MDIHLALVLQARSFIQMCTSVNEDMLYFDILKIACADVLSTLMVDDSDLSNIVLELSRTVYQYLFWEFI